MSEDKVVATVKNIIINGKHGAYAVCRAKDYGYITFSLDDRKVWRGEHPESGTQVVLGKIFKKPNGWRAGKARLYKLQDEATQKGAESSEKISRKAG